MHPAATGLVPVERRLIGYFVHARSNLHCRKRSPRLRTSLVRFRFLDVCRPNAGFVVDASSSSHRTRCRSYFGAPVRERQSQSIPHQHQAARGSIPLRALGQRTIAAHGSRHSAQSILPQLFDQQRRRWQSESHRRLRSQPIAAPSLGGSPH